MKRILVTGANKGIGQAIEDFPDNNLLLGSRDVARQNAIQQIIDKSGGAKRVEIVQIDVTSDESRPGNNGGS